MKKQRGEKFQRPCDDCKENHHPKGKTKYCRGCMEKRREVGAEKQRAKFAKRGKQE